MDTPNCPHIDFEVLGGDELDQEVLVATVLHDGDPEPFQAEYPNVRDRLVSQDPEAVVDEHLELERDVNSEAVARAVVEGVRAQLEGIPVVLIKVRFPRGIVDANRMVDANGDPAIRPIVRGFHDVEDWKSELRLMETWITGLMRRNPKALLFDSHTMWDQNPEGSAPFEPRSLRGYNDTYLNSSGPRRHLDLITGRPETSGMSRLHARSRDEIRGAGFNLGINDPYGLGPHMDTILCGRWLLEFEARVTCLDMYKKATGRREGTSPRFAADPDRIQKVARPVSSAFVGEFRDLSPSRWAA